MEQFSIGPNSLAQMLEGQRALLKEYIEIEGLPEYPLDLQTKSSQRLIKEFIGRFLEELSEAFSELMMAYDAVSTNRQVQAKKFLREYNTELADAWHFLCEILIYSGVQEEELEEMVRHWVSIHDQFENFYKEGKPFKALLMVAQYENQNEGRISIINRPDRFIIASEDEMIEDPLLVAGRRISETLLEQHGHCLWNITHQCYKLTNLMKNRGWTRTERSLNEPQYRGQLTEILLAMAIYMDFIGMGEIGMVRGFNLKGQELMGRIKGGY